MRRDREAPQKKDTVRDVGLPLHPEAGDAAVLKAVFAYYHQTLKDSPAALQYLRRRGLTSSDMVGHFHLGFANRTLGLRLPLKNRKAGNEIREQLTRLGILRETGHEHFNGAVVVPVHDDNGQIVQAYGRKVTDKLHSGLAEHLLLRPEGTGVWNRRVLTSSRDIILCRSLMDALTFWCHGHWNVTAVFGPDANMTELLAAFREDATARVYVAFRNSAAGDAEALKIAGLLTAAGIEPLRVRFLPGMDANEHFLRAGAPAALRAALDNATPIDSAPVPPDPRPERPPKVRRKAPTVPTEPRTAPVPPPVPPATEEPPTAPPPATTDVPDVPPAPAGGADGEIVLTFGDRRYRVRGLERNTTYNVLKVNVLCSSTAPDAASCFHVDTLDLYSARQRNAFITQAATELAEKEDVIKRDLGRVLLSLEERQDQIIRRAVEPKQSAVTLTDVERDAALSLLRDPQLLSRIGADFDRCGVVGEEANKLTGYIAAVSRKLESPLGIVIQSSSAAGKTSLMDAVLAFVPPEDRVKYSAMTGQSLYYLGAGEIRHKILAIAEEEGVQDASYALKLLQSEGELNIASTGKDASTGRLVTQEYRVEGPVMLFLTTTAVQIDEELLNRCVVLTVDENRDQTRAIHRLQREQQTLQGLLARHDTVAVRKLHQNAQRLLRPLIVVNPFAPRLTFLDDRTRTRRDHLKYLTLIRAVTLLHQHQRPVKTVQHDGKDVEYVEVTVEDVATANRLAGATLGRSLDELPPHTRNVLLAVERLVAEQCRSRNVERHEFYFSRRDVREFTGAGNTQLKVHLQRLVDMEYVVVHRGGRGQGTQYELVYDGGGRDGAPFLPGLIDTADLRVRPGVAGPESEVAGGLAGGSRPPDGPKSGGGRGAISSPNGLQARPSRASRKSDPRKPRPGTLNGTAVHVGIGDA